MTGLAVIANCSPSPAGDRVLRTDEGTQVCCGRGKRDGRISARRALQIQDSVVSSRAEDLDAGRPIDVSHRREQPVVVGQVNVKDEIRRLFDGLSDVGFFNRNVEKVEKKARAWIADGAYRIDTVGHAVQVSALVPVDRLEKDTGVGALDRL